MSDMKLIVVGAAGRMGRTLTRIVTESEGVTVAGADRPRRRSPEIGQDAGMLAGVGELGVAVTADPLPLFAKADGVLDFTVPAATVAFAELAAQARIAHIIGTTGLGADDEAKIAAAARHARDRQVGQHEPRRQPARRAGPPGGEGARRRISTSRCWRCTTAPRWTRPRARR